MKKKRMSKVEGSIVAHIKKLTQDKRELDNYFHWDSECWYAIKKHIGSAKKCLLIDKPSSRKGKAFPVVMARGSGPVISLKDVFCGHKATEFGICFAVVYDDPDMFDKRVTKEYRLFIPCDLEDNFTTEKFDAWAREVAEKIRLEREQKDLPELQKLVAKYPDQVKKMLENDAK